MSACTIVLHAERARAKKNKKEIQIKSFYSHANHQMTVLLYGGSFNHHEARELHKSPEF